MDEKINRPTAGQIALDILNKETEFISPVDVAEENTKDYMTVLFETLDNGKKTFPQQDFFIVVNLKHEQVLKVFFRNLFEIRQTCPSPFFDQSVYRYDHLKDELDLIWALPDEKACWKIYENRNNMDPSQYELLNYVLEARDGTLWKKMKKLNGEKFDSILLENK